MPTADCQKRVFILIAPGFEEASAIYCMARLREASLSVSLVGLAAGRVTGWHGLTILPDLTLDQVGEDEALKLVVIPGGRQCATMLLIKPPQWMIWGNESLVNVVAKQGQQNRLMGLDNCAKKIGYNGHDGVWGLV